MKKLVTTTIFLALFSHLASVALAQSEERYSAYFSDDESDVDVSVDQDIHHESIAGEGGKGFSMNIPVVVKNGYVYLASIGYIDAQTKEGQTVQQKYVDGHYEDYDRRDGRSSVMLVGATVRNSLLETNMGWIEAELSLRYGLRLGGTTEFGEYSENHNGEIYNPYGGIVASAGINVIPKFKLARGWKPFGGVSLVKTSKASQKGGGLMLTFGIRK